MRIDMEELRRLNSMPLNQCIEILARQEQQAQAERAQRAASSIVPSRGVVIRKGGASASASASINRAYLTNLVSRYGADWLRYAE